VPEDRSRGNGSCSRSFSSKPARTIQSLVRLHWRRTSRRTVKRFTGGSEIRHFVMAITVAAERRASSSRRQFQDLVPPGASGNLPFPEVTDPAAPPIRPQRHVPNSIATMHRILLVAIARMLPRCPCCARRFTRNTRHGNAAQTWLRLAEEQEHESANVDSPPPSAVEDRPVVQQQQQIQVGFSCYPHACGRARHPPKVTASRSPRSAPRRTAGGFCLFCAILTPRPARDPPEFDRLRSPRLGRPGPRASLCGNGSPADPLAWQRTNEPRP
jgi:hypothetical protein